MSVTDPSIVDLLREKAEAHEKAAAEQWEQARRARAAIAALEGTVPAQPFVLPPMLPVPGLPFTPPWAPFPGPPSWDVYIGAPPPGQGSITISGVTASGGQVRLHS
jgi:hypothetical protein